MFGEKNRKTENIFLPSMALPFLPNLLKTGVGPSVVIIKS